MIFPAFYSLNKIRSPYPLVVTPHLHLIPISLATTNLLSISADLPILDFSYKWSIQSMDICVWLHSLSIMFSRAIQAIACIRTYFSWLNSIPLHGYVPVYSLFSWRTFELSPPFGYWYAAKNTDTQNFSLNTCFPFLGGTHLGVESLAHVIILWLTYWEMQSVHFYQVTALWCILDLLKNG